MPQSVILQQAVEDPVLSKFEMGHRRLYYPLGFPLEVQTNSCRVIEAASETWGLFQQSFDIAPMCLALGVRQTTEAEPLLAKSNILSREHLLTVIANADNFLTCDFQRAYSFGWITPEVASDYDTLRYRFLTPAAMMMAAQLALAPVHGALIVRGGCGVLLCGESLAGKSTLAYACARAGWTYVSDDGTFLMRDRSDRYAIGNPHTIRFREDARELFPELADQLLITRPNGKIGMELFTRDLPIAIASGATIEHVVMLDRHRSGAARLRHYSKDQMQAWSERFVNFGSNEVRNAQAHCYQRLLGAGLWELSYANCGDAIKRLEQLVDSGG
jgi:hypothetical protein